VYHAASQFELVTGSIPTCWAVTFKSNTFIKCAPTAWLQDGFWDRFFDRDRETMKLFADIYRKIVAEDP
jgi:hypothetical protein